MPIPVMFFEKESGGGSSLYRTGPSLRIPVNREDTGNTRDIGLDLTDFGGSGMVFGSVYRSLRGVSLLIQ